MEEKKSSSKQSKSKYPLSLGGHKGLLSKTVIKTYQPQTFEMYSASQKFPKASRSKLLPQTSRVLNSFEPCSFRFI